MKWRAKSGHDRSEPDADNVGRTWSDVIVADVDGDNEVEIITAHGKGYVSVYNKEGYFESGWPKRPSDRELRGLKVADIDQDGTSEIIVAAGVGSIVGRRRESGCPWRPERRGGPSSLGPRAGFCRGGGVLRA